MAKQWACQRCGATWGEADCSESAVRRRLAAEFDCAPADVHQEDADIGGEECPGCGYIAWVREVVHG
jgi:hypothetical protein